MHSMNDCNEYDTGTNGAVVPELYAATIESISIDGRKTE
jgi:hypothetical protein